MVDITTTISLLRYHYYDIATMISPLGTQISLQPPLSGYDPYFSITTTYASPLCTPSLRPPLALRTPTSLRPPLRTPMSLPSPLAMTTSHHYDLRTSYVRRYALATTTPAYADYYDIATITTTISLRTSILQRPPLGTQISLRPPLSGYVLRSLRLYF